MKKLALSVIASMSILSLSVSAADLNTTTNILTPPPVLENVQIDTEPTYFGYNYIGFGVETATYKENGTKNGVNFKSSATSSSPVYTSGGLIKMNKYFDFSIDASSTLMPTTSDEKWQNVDQGGLMQENKFDSVQSDLKFLFQYKINNNHRIAIGPNYNLFSMKRHTYSYDGQSLTGVQYGLSQEDIATLNLMIGYVYEYAPFSNGGMRIKTAALYGKPIWNKATNTAAEEIEFSSTKGFTADLDGYVGFELAKGLEAGFFGRYSLKQKTDSDSLSSSTDIIWPENELETFRYGVSFTWNFDVK